MASRLVSGVGAGGAALVAAVQPGLLVAVLLAVAALGGLLLLLISTLALVAVYSRDPVRRAAAGKILTQLLGALRPRLPSIRRAKPVAPGAGCPVCEPVAVVAPLMRP